MVDTAALTAVGSTITVTLGRTVGSDVDDSLTLASGNIPNLSAGHITSGTLSAARVPNLNANKITAGTLDDARIPAAIARDSEIASYARATPTGTIADAQIPAAIARDSELPDVSGFLDQSEVDGRIATYARISPSGQIADAQIPASIARDSELPAAGVTVQDGGTQEGAGIETLNFGTNLAVAVASGVATITGQAGGGGGASLSDDAPVDVGASGASGTGSLASRDDHRHRGVTSVSPSGPGITINPIRGDVVVTHSHDGVADDLDYGAADGVLTIGRSVGTSLTVNIDELVHPDSNGDLPDPEDRQGRVAVSGNQLLHSIDHGAVDKVVEFKAYGPDRVVESGEPALLTDETDYQGSFAAPPPLANYSVGDFLWDRGSSVWLIRRSGSTTWGTTGGPHGYAPGHLYATEAAAALHVTGSGYFHPGGVVIYGQGSAQRPYVIVGFTAASAASWQWDPIGVTPNEVDGAIDARLSDDDPEDVATAADEGTSTATARSDHVHELAPGVVTTPKYGTQSLSGSKLQLETVSSTDANTRVLLFDTADDQIGTGRIGTVNLLDGAVTSAKLASGAAGVVIAPYSSTATYSRGSNNSFVTDGGELYVYTSGSERSSNHNPGTNPQYWFRVSHGAEFINVGSGSHRYKAGTFLLVDNAIYLATTNITTPRAAAYIIANAGDNQEFLLVNGGSGGGSDLAVQEEGTEVASAATTINFTGSGATATASGGTVTVDIPGGGVSTVAFHAGISADTAVTSSQTTWTQVLQLGSADINEGSFTIESQSDDTERVCVPDDGLYVVRAQIGAAADANTTQRFTLESRFTITPDGGTETAQDEIARQYNRGRDTDAASGATNLSGGHLAAMYDLDADDCIGVQTRTQLSAINYTVQSAVSYVEIVKQQVGEQGPAGAAGADGSDVDFEDEGSARAGVTTVDFTGAGVTATVSGGVLDVAIPGGSGGGGGVVEFDSADAYAIGDHDVHGHRRFDHRLGGRPGYRSEQYRADEASTRRTGASSPAQVLAGGLSRTSTSTCLRRGDIFWLEHSGGDQKVYFVRTSQNYTTEAELTDADDVIDLTAGGGGASLSDATPDALTPDQAGAAGTSSDASRADHAHQMTAGTAQTIGTSNAEGSGSTVARSDHRHQGVASIATSGTGLTHSSATGTVTLTHTAHTQRALATATPEDVQDTGAVGTGTEVARTDHVHQLPIDNTLAIRRQRRSRRTDFDGHRPARRGYPVLQHGHDARGCSAGIERRRVPGHVSVRKAYSLGRVGFRGRRRRPQLHYVLRTHRQR